MSALVQLSEAGATLRRGDASANGEQRRPEARVYRLLEADGTQCEAKHLAPPGEDAFIPHFRVEHDVPAQHGRKKTRKVYLPTRVLGSGTFGSAVLYEPLGGSPGGALVVKSIYAGDDDGTEDPFRYDTQELEMIGRGLRAGVVEASVALRATRCGSAALKRKDPESWTVVVMDKWDGTLADFDDRRAHRALPASDVLAIVSGVARAAEAACRAHGVSWVDGKSQNVLYRSEGETGIRIALGDLGGFSRLGVNDTGMCIPTFPCPWDPLDAPMCGERLTVWNVVSILIQLYAGRLTRGSVPWPHGPAWWLLSYSYNSDKKRATTFESAVETMEALHAMDYRKDTDTAIVRDFILRMLCFCKGDGLCRPTISDRRLTFDYLEMALRGSQSPLALKTPVGRAGLSAALSTPDLVAVESPLCI